MHLMKRTWYKYKPVEVVWICMKNIWRAWLVDIISGGGAADKDLRTIDLIMRYYTPDILKDGMHSAVEFTSPF